MLSFRTCQLGHTWLHLLKLFYFYFTFLDCQFTNVTFPPSLNSLKIIIQNKAGGNYFISSWQNNRHRCQAVGIEYFLLRFYSWHKKVINKSLNRNSRFLFLLSSFFPVLYYSLHFFPSLSFSLLFSIFSLFFFFAFVFHSKYLTFLFN